MKQLLSALKEREKELHCLYRVEAVLQKPNLSLEQVFRQFLKMIPPGWQFPEVCRVKIIYRDKTFTPEDFKETQWKQQASLIVDENVEGAIFVYYIEEDGFDRNEPFLPEEQKLLNAIAERLSMYIFHKRLERTMAYLEAPVKPDISHNELNFMLTTRSDEHWKWRESMARKIAGKLDFKAFGARAIYLIGSVKEASAGPASDLDLIVHIKNDAQNIELLKIWIDGWSLCLAELNYLKTGYPMKDGLIDLHVVTDEDIKNKTSFAVMIRSVDHRARLLNKAGEPSGR